MHNKILQILFPFCSDDKEMLFVSGCGGCSGGVGDVAKSCCRITRRFGVNRIRDKCKHTKLHIYVHIGEHWSNKSSGTVGGTTREFVVGCLVAYQQ